jgi:tetratricopeptide (TPR) repeat protein
LGVILYELVCGAWPFGDPNSVISELNRAAGYVAVTPPAEAVRVETAGDRSLPADALTRLLQGELSTILLKLLESEPARRYGSARQVIEDLERYRQGRPILARPQTAWYAARKFVGRNWLLVSAAGLGVLALAGLTVFSLYQSVQAREQAARAQRISEFVKNTFVSGSSTWQSPLRGQSRAIQFQDVLDSAAERVGKELANDPVAEADLRGTIGSTYSVLGDPVKGEAQILQAIQLLKRTPDGSPRVAADLQARLCDTRSYQGHFAEAWAACREALDLARRNPGSTLWLGGTIHDTAYMAVKSGAPFAEAEKLYREAAADLPKDESKRKLWPAIINTRIGFMRIEQGDLVEGDRLLRGAEQLLRAEPGPPIEIIPTLNARAFRERVRGNYNEAVKLLSEAVDLLTARPTSYMGVDGIELELAADEALAGNPRALPRLQRVQARLTPTASAPVERVRLELLSGIVEARSGLAESAARRFRSALAISEKEVPRQPAERAELCLRLAQVLAASGRAQEALQVARQGLENAEVAYGAFFSQHPFVIELRKAAR